MARKVAKKARRKPVAERRLERKVEILENDKLLLAKDRTALTKERDEGLSREADLTAKLNAALMKLMEANDRNDALHDRNKRLTKVNEEQRVMNAALQEDAIRHIRKSGDLQRTLFKARSTGAIYAALYLLSPDGLNPVQKLDTFSETANKNETSLESLGDEAIEIHQMGSVLFSKLTINALKEIKAQESRQKRGDQGEISLSSIEALLAQVLSARR